MSRLEQFPFLTLYFSRGVGGHLRCMQEPENVVEKPFARRSIVISFRLLS